VAIATIASLSLITAACGSDTATESVPPSPAPATAPESTPADAGFPVTVDVYGTPFTLDARPERIVSLSPSSTEGLFAIGAGPQVVAVDEWSTYPEDAPRTTLSGLTPNVEAIVTYDPDLVIVEGDRGDVIAALSATGIQVLLLEAAIDLDDVLHQLRILGAVTGNTQTAADLITELEARIATAIATAPSLDVPLAYFHLLDPDMLYTVTSGTFVGSVYGVFGLVNIADAADPDGSAGGYPLLSTEFLVDADPDLVFLSTGDVASFAALPVLGQLRAVEAGGVIALAPDISSRWGPRVVDFLEQIARAVAELAAAGTAVLVR
jgi:iron complex transport system substrate-binding protein